MRYELEETNEGHEAAARLLAGLLRLAKPAAAESAWAAEDYHPAPRAAQCGPRIAYAHGWVELASIHTASTPRAHRGLVRVWRITAEGRRRAGN